MTGKETGMEDELFVPVTAGSSSSGSWRREERDRRQTRLAEIPPDGCIRNEAPER